MPKLVLANVWFLSHLDEELFFLGLNRISAVTGIKGYGELLELRLTSRVSDKALRELLGLFSRYRIEMRQLAQFLNSHNRGWFFSPNAFWFEEVFGDRPVGQSKVSARPRGRRHLTRASSA